MGAEAKKMSADSGQAMVEFLLLLPAMVILLVVMVRVNTAIQVSIVNQQYARAQALWLTFNSSIYPELRHRVKNFQTGNKMSNQMVIGVSQNSFPDEETDDVYQPEATVQNVSRLKTGGNDDPQTEPDARSKVRIRTTVSLCTQPNIGPDGPLLQMDQADFKTQGTWTLKDSTIISYCVRPTS
jgi:hypothetical protein